MRKPLKLGKPTANGYRISKGSYLNGGKLVQKYFWLGHDARLAVEKMIALEEIAELWICPELAEMLIARISKTPNNADNYALLTENDMPLLHTTANGHDTDSIGLVWDCLRRRVLKLGGRSFPFDSLRRFAGQAVSNMGDPFLAQVFLAQVPQSVLEQHYAGRGIGIGIGQTAFEKVQDIQRKVYAALKPMFDAVNEPTAKLVERIANADAANATAA